MQSAAELASMATYIDRKRRVGKKVDESRMVPPGAASCAWVLFAHGLILIAIGVFDAKSHGWKRGRAFHSALFSGGSITVCAAMMVSGSYGLYTAGVHLGLAVQAVFILVFAVQSYRHHQDPQLWGSDDVGSHFELAVVKGLVSIIALCAMIMLKPKPVKSKTA